MYAAMNVWAQIWVQGRMCWNDTIKLEWYIYDASFYIYNVLFKAFQEGMSKLTLQLLSCPVFDENPKNTGKFFLLFLSSNIAPWVWTEWTNMCLNSVMQKIKIMNLLACLNEAFWLVTMKKQYFNLAKSHANYVFTFMFIQFIWTVYISTGL